MTATTVMSEALDGGIIKADNDATLNLPDTAAAQRHNLWAAALFQELFSLTHEQFVL